MLMGPNGSGKSTLMQTIAGLIPPLSGELSVAGELITKLKHKERAKLMSLVLTERIEHGSLSVWDIVSTGRYPYTGLRGKLLAHDIEIMEHSLSVCRVSEMKHRYYSELSDGEKQRVMIARALAQDTPLMLLDEPTAHLDLPSRLEVLTMLRDLARELKKGIIVSTHELDLALQWADMIWLLDRQRSATAAAPEDLVLSGHISRVFGNERLSFDEVSVEFRLERHSRQAVHLIAEGLQHAWATRALRRMGYYIGEGSDGEIPHIIADVGGWQLSYQGVEVTAEDLWTLQQALQRYYPIKE